MKKKLGKIPLSKETLHALDPQSVMGGVSGVCTTTNLCTDSCSVPNCPSFKVLSC